MMRSVYLYAALSKTHDIPIFLLPPGNLCYNPNLPTNGLDKYAGNNLLQNDFRLNHSVLCLSSPLYQPRPTVPCFQYKIQHHCTYNNAQAWLYMNSYRSVLNVLFSMVNRSGRHCNLLDRCINQSQETEIEKTRSWQIVPCLNHALF